MAPFPLPLQSLLGKAGMYAVFLLIGVAFGWVLEISGFARSQKLAAQFYFKDLTVLKVMFTAIVVAMVLIFGASALGLLDYNLVYVNETYLWPGIVGGLVMGVGFIVGGFCPGTSLVSAATFKLDGLFFALGGLFGIFAFGETVGLFDDWWHGSYLGRFTLPQWLGLDTGLVVVLVVLMALFMFWGGEHLERLFGGKDLKREPLARVLGAGGLLLAAAAVAFIGQPTTADRWARLAPSKQPALEAREVQVQPGEVLARQADPRLNLVLLDVRAEADYNLFHLRGARHAPLPALPGLVDELLAEPAGNTVYIVMSNDEVTATEAWKLLTAESVPNVYILEGGVNAWLAAFAAGDPAVTPAPALFQGDQLRFQFAAALGDRYPAAAPDPHVYALEYEARIKLQPKRGPSGGGCG
jgi:rhodanese-related sulfurtransferase